MAVRSNRTGALLFILVAASAVGQSALTQAKDAGEMIALNPQTLKFITIPSMPSCATGAILRGNPRFGPAWVLLKLTSGCKVPWHWHTANEDMLIVSGKGNFDMQGGAPLQFVPGAYASLPSHHVHRANCARACLMFSIADAAFDINYVDASGRAISADQALNPPVTTTRKKPVAPKSKKK